MGRGKIKFSTSCHQLLCSTPRLLWDPFSFSTDVLREWGWGLEGRKEKFYCAWWDTVTQEAPRPSVKLLFTAALWLVKNLLCKLLEKALICCTQLQENHWQVTTRTVLVEGFGMKLNLSFPSKLSEEHMKCKTKGIAPRGIGLLCFSYFL